ncbi:hypothetical protein SK355_13245 [Candidatus Fukatsuia symbiotica]|uniref:Uncharacterized protein n=1 Tax=Candidatus Fukatsuia symbiotica TaxID=1878942 RepID=A0A2U8I819_9GAMM|nr:hypothetical protein [Candidatus Fukatsuia symbiotica]AWK14104.1 hypothetical protein CCS41_05825 [Candidatus Fukatsuia symbiotica]MEA9446125.1 hypothetical protein [Candidatus Fukatsuia symbiotica]
MLAEPVLEKLEDMQAWLEKETCLTEYTLPPCYIAKLKRRLIGNKLKKFSVLLDNYYSVLNQLASSSAPSLHVGMGEQEEQIGIKK